MNPTEATAVWGEPERRRLVRLCAALSGDRHAAEDLAQETLLEAWRNARKLHDPAGADRWLAAVARNVCLRWARRRGRDGVFLASGDAREEADDAPDIELQLERRELADLLDRALALLPAETREVLVHRYVDELPHAEIGARLGLSADAVSMRVTRGKGSLRRLLASELRDEAAAYGLVEGSHGSWHETRIWCLECGNRKLVVRKQPPPGALSFRCPGCDPEAASSEYALGNPLFARLLGDLVRPAAMLARAADWSWAYFAAGTEASDAACTRCGRPVAVRRYFRDRTERRRDGLFAECAACGEEVSSSVHGLAFVAPAVREFRREHPRTRALPARDVEADGVPALVVRCEDALGSAGVDVVFARDSLRVLHAACD